MLVAAGLGDARIFALLSLLALNGLRVSEATGADIEQLGLERGHRTLRIVRKGGKFVVVPLAPRTARAVDLAVGERTEGPIFCGNDHGRLERHAAARIVRRIARRAGITKRVGPHTLRHAFIKHQPGRRGRSLHLSTRDPGDNPRHTRLRRGRAHTTVTILGSGFSTAKAIHFGSAAAQSFSVHSDAVITAVSPTGAGTVDITVTTAKGTTRKGTADHFIYLPASTTVASYSYNGDGLRTSKKVGTTTTTFSWDISGATPTLLADTTASYIYGPAGLPIENITNNNATINYYHHDQLGNTTMLTSAAGTTVATYTYTSFGQLLSGSTSATPILYAGQYRDAESGLYYLRARYYHPATGQFMSVDPLAAATASPYSYTTGDPVNNADPRGLESQSVEEQNQELLVLDTVSNAETSTQVLLTEAKSYSLWNRAWSNAALLGQGAIYTGYASTMMGVAGAAESGDWGKFFSGECGARIGAAVGAAACIALAPESGGVSVAACPMAEAAGAVAGQKLGELIGPEIQPAVERLCTASVRGRTAPPGGATTKCRTTHPLDRRSPHGILRPREDGLRSFA